MPFRDTGPSQPNKTKPLNNQYIDGLPDGYAQTSPPEEFPKAIDTTTLGLYGLSDALKNAPLTSTRLPGSDYMNSGKKAKEQGALQKLLEKDRSTTKRPGCVDDLLFRLPKKHWESMQLIEELTPEEIANLIKDLSFQNLKASKTTSKKEDGGPADNQFPDSIE